MLSYRHAFHAGNHADVLKHFVLSQVLRYYNGKDKPFWYIDTHAGAGMYALDSEYASQNAEFQHGIAALWGRNDLPEELAAYVALIRGFNADHSLRYYPGSPAIARAMLRNEDRLRLFELHPSDLKLLRQNCKSSGKKVIIEGQDGFAGLKSVLPPLSRRAVVLIDPSYELKQDYFQVIDAIKDSLQRFATGTYMLWYPMLQRPEPAQLVDKLRKLPLRNWLHVSLQVQAPAEGGYGMHGSGLFIINPPWTLPDILERNMPTLSALLAMDADAGFSLSHEIP